MKPLKIKVIKTFILLLFLVDLYLTICRTTMSLGATAFMELTRNKYELQYRGDISQRPVEDKRGWLDKVTGR
jgi:hypothetical protein